MYAVTSMSVDELANKIHRDYMLGWITEDEYRDALECLADKILNERGISDDSGDDDVDADVPTDTARRGCSGGAHRGQRGGGGRGGRR